MASAHASSRGRCKVYHGVECTRTGAISGRSDETRRDDAGGSAPSGSRRVEPSLFAKCSCDRSLDKSPSNPRVRSENVSGSTRFFTQQFWCSHTIRIPHNADKGTVATGRTLKSTIKNWQQKHRHSKNISNMAKNK